MTYNKWQSRRWWICIWAIGVLSVSFIIKYDSSWIMIIAAIPPTYIASESYTKTHKGNRCAEN